MKKMYVINGKFHPGLEDKLVQSKLSKTSTDIWSFEVGNHGNPEGYVGLYIDYLKYRQEKCKTCGVITPQIQEEETKEWHTPLYPNLYKSLLGLINRSDYPILLIESMPDYLTEDEMIHKAGISEEEIKQYLRIFSSYIAKFRDDSGCDLQFSDSAQKKALINGGLREFMKKGTGKIPKTIMEKREVPDIAWRTLFPYTLVEVPFWEVYSILGISKNKINVGEWDAEDGQVNKRWSRELTIPNEKIRKIFGYLLNK